MSQSCTFDQWYREVCRDAGSMDRPKSFLSPRNLIICVATCTVAALWAVVFAALYFYFFVPGLSTAVQNVTEVAVPLFRPDQLPWYLNGTILPSNTPDEEAVALWHHQLPLQPLVRLQNQLMFLPRGSEETRIVLFWSDWSPSEVEDYQASQCPVKSCVFTNSRKMLSKANAIVFRNPTKLLNDLPQEYYRPRSQVWVFNSLSMPKEGEFIHPRDVFNWTATPRMDSDIPMFPNGVWMYFDTRWKHQDPPLNQVGQKYLAAAAWFPTTCDEQSPAYHYVNRLQQHTLVDGFSSHPACGDRCPQGRAHICLKLLQDKYRVTLVLEDRNCNHSIPDMFYLALKADTVPVVISPSRAIYEQVVPEGSFIHVDDFVTPRDLARHLETIYESDAVFNKYLSWKGTGQFVKTWYCQLCALLHHNSPLDIEVEDINQWWNPEGECSS